MISLAVLTVAYLSAPVMAERYLISGDEDDVKSIKVVEKKGAYIGIYLEDLDDEIIEKLDYPKSKGVWIRSVVEESPAEQAGLEGDDVIYIFAGEKVEDSEHLLELVADKEPGEMVDITVYRDGEKKEFKLELGQQAKQFYTLHLDDIMTDLNDKFGEHSFTITADPRFDALKKFSWQVNRGYLGVQIQGLNEDLAGYFGVSEGEGVLVLEVMEDTPAEKAGIKSGDVIIEVAGEKISDTEGVLDAIADLDEDEEYLTVVVIRKGDRKSFDMAVEDLHKQRGVFIAPKELDRYKHFKVKVPEIKLDELKEKELKVELEKSMKELQKEIEKLEKRLKELEKEKDR